VWNDTILRANPSRTRTDTIEANNMYVVISWLKKVPDLNKIAIDEEGFFNSFKTNGL
jgi:hypothetical protein